MLILHLDSTITKDLKMYLGTRFQKGSVDYEVQESIRKNLYQRTTPCELSASQSDRSVLIGLPTERLIGWHSIYDYIKQGIHPFIQDDISFYTKTFLSCIPRTYDLIGLNLTNETLSISLLNSNILNAWKQ